MSKRKGRNKKQEWKNFRSSRPDLPLHLVSFSLLSSVGLAHLSLAAEQMLGFLDEYGAIGLADTRLFVQQLALGFLLEQFDLARHGVVAHARLVTRHSRTAAHTSLGVLARPLHRLVRLAACSARVVVRLVLLGHVQAEVAHRAFEAAARHLLGRAWRVSAATLGLVESRLEYA